ncbi:MAG TPA: ferritin-like domain-containing protein [Vicinamibacterales bacterium]|jgi:ferritin-like metal-binding protein YciE|nr:ferritin-like domain-containing protein [Vicinamibacterales bacterium]
MSAKSLRELFVEELRDMYDGEKRLTRALPKMARAAESGELQTALRSHLKETERQVTRLEQVFRSVGEKPRGKKCDGIMGIVEEGNKAMEEFEGPVLDAALIAGAQKVEHYEIASYGTLAYFADLLENDRAKELLGETLDEEKAADQKLTTIARSRVNRKALLAGDESEEEPSSGLRIPQAVRSAAASMGLAYDRRPSSGRSSGRRRSTTRRSR